MKKIASVSLSLILAFIFTANVSAAGTLSLSQNNVSLNVGQNITLTAYPSAGQVVNLTSLTNSSVVLYNIFSNQISISGVANGNTDMMFCTFDNSCGIVHVTVGGSGGNSGQISFGQNNVGLNTNQTLTVSVFNSNGSVYISNNSNSNAVSAYVSGNNINLTGLNSGSSTITVCGNNVSCNYLYVTVSGNNSGQISFNPSTIGLDLNQSTVGTIYSSYNPNNSAYYISSNSNPNVVTASITGSNIYLYGQSSGTSSISVCQAGSQCGILTVTVSGSIAGASTYNNGTLVNDNGTIYITYKNTKSAFSNINAFSQLGYKLSNVISGGTSGLNNSGFIISNASIAHPWGSWVKNGSTIYFVHDSGLIPISSFSVFTGNGGILASVVNANSYDLNRPMLSPMVSNDQRLK